MVWPLLRMNCVLSSGSMPTAGAEPEPEPAPQLPEAAHAPLVQVCVTVLPSCARRWPEPLDPQTKVQVAPAAVSRHSPVVPLGASSVGQAGPADTASPQSRPTVSKICVTWRPPSAGAADCSVLAQEEDEKVDHAAEHAAWHVVGLHTAHGWQGGDQDTAEGLAPLTRRCDNFPAYSRPR